MSKQLSMKKLTYLAGQHTIERYKNRFPDMPETVREELAREHLEELNEFITYVWEHKEDSL